MRKILLALLLIIISASLYVLYSLPDNTLWDTHSLTESTGNRPSLSSPSESMQQWAYRIEVVASNLFVPWSIVFTQSNRILVTERNGRLREIRDGKLTEAPIHEFKEVSNISEEGLMGLAIDPEYARNRFIYLCLAYPSNDGLFAKVVKGKDMGNTVSEISTIMDDIPAARYHAGCDLKFWPDRKLYITTGDANQKKRAQDPSSLGGKILRLNSDGTIPEDNPSPDSPVYSLGHRNSQGIDWASDGTMYSTEHGPSVFDGPPGGDEVNLIRAWDNYGWPLVSHNRTQSGLISPLQVFTPALAPASALIYTGDYFPELKGNLLFGALIWERMVRIVFDRDHPEKILQTEKLLIPHVGRIREVMEGPDGMIYFSTSNRDGRGKPGDNDDSIYRLMRE